MRSADTAPNLLSTRGLPPVRSNLNDNFDTPDLALW